ncbi:hypothetical protein AAVH_09694 [Aphelenchoides avenae]|nr:hypothetical protein AAVH_09694 [Aphelenchus avenae]
MCEKHEIIREKHCRKSCGTCKDTFQSNVEICVDSAKADTCKLWVEHGYCKTKDIVREKHCRKSCGNCQEVEAGRAQTAECFDTVKKETCDLWVKNGLCKKYDIVRDKHCPKACNNCDGQLSKTLANTVQIAENAKKYIVASPNECVDTAATCDIWKQKGLCTKYADVKDKHCRKSCGACR